MKNYENCPVNEWNAEATRLSDETAWPWDVVVPRSSGCKEIAAENGSEKSSAVAQIDIDSSGTAWRSLKQNSIAIV